MKRNSKKLDKAHFKTTLTRRQFCETSAAAIATVFVPTKSLASIGNSRSETASAVPTLDDLGTEWLDCSQLAHMPSLHNFHEMAACAPDMVGVNFLPGGQLYKDSGPRWFIYNTLPICRMSVDGRAYDSADCKWFAYQSVRRVRTPDLEIVTTNRLVMEDTVILWRVTFRDTSATKKTIKVRIDTDGVRREVMGEAQLAAKSQKFGMSAIYHFPDPPITSTGGQYVEWELTLLPEEHREIRFLMRAGAEDAASQHSTLISWFESEWIRAKMSGRSAGVVLLRQETRFSPAMPPL